jgi:hypothetical protein
MSWWRNFNWRVPLSLRNVKSTYHVYSKHDNTPVLVLDDTESEVYNIVGAEGLPEYDLKARYNTELQLISSIIEKYEVKK